MAKKHGARFSELVEEARRQVRECTVHELKERLDRGEPFILIDVREESEFAADHVPGAIHLGRGILERDVEEKVPAPGTELVLYCGGGFRSVLAAESLKKMGYSNVTSMEGGIRAWRDVGYPLIR